jgi:hypothetical protein
MNNSRVRYLLVVPVIIVMVLLMFNKCTNKTKDNSGDSDTNVIVNNILEMTEEQQKRFASDVTKAVINDDFRSILEKTYLIDSQAYYSLNAYAREAQKGSISEMVIDYIDADKSSTKDTVIMCNAKVWYEDASYNLVYTFEYHINSNGYLYGYNIWVH